MNTARDGIGKALSRRFRPYPVNKDSGVHWLGKIPKHWEVRRLSWLATCLDGKRIPLNSEERARMLGGYPYWGANGIVDYVDRWLFDEELVLLGEDGAPFFDRSRPVAFRIKGRVWVNNHAHVLRPQPMADGRFLAHALNCVDYRAFIDGSTRDKLTQGDMRGIPIQCPEMMEQRAIAAFLDLETARIDGLVARKERLIALLQEKRTALITRAVTRGLDPNVPMKDIDVEWLGEIPSHWDVKKIKRLCTVRRGASPRPIEDPVYFDDQGEYAWVRIADVTASGKYLDMTSQRLSDAGASKSVPLEPGELFVSIAATVGKPIIARIRCCIHDGFVHFRNLHENREYLYYLFSCGEPYKGLGKLGTQLNLNTDTIGDIYVPIPPAAEERAIVQFLDRGTASIDDAIAKVRQAIDLQMEFRTALISAAVTGKIDVRGAVPQ